MTILESAFISASGRCWQRDENQPSFTIQHACRARAGNLPRVLSKTSLRHGALHLARNDTRRMDTKYLIVTRFYPCLHL